MEVNDENAVGSNELIDTEQLERIHKSLKGTVDTTTKRAIDKFTYEEKFEPATFKLIEVTEEIAAHVLEGKEFYVSGLPDDQMVLCTNDRTYSAKEVERSNAMLICNMDSAPKKIINPVFREFKICSMLTRNVELIKASLYKPARFREILSSRELNIFEDEPVFPEKQMNVKQIYSSLPLSEQQVQCLLDKYPVFEINRSVYCLNREGRGELIKELAYFLGDCDYDRIRKSDLAESSIFTSLNSRFPSAVDSIIQWVFRSFFDSVNDSTYKLNQTNFVREISVHILRKHASTRFIELDEMEKQFYRLMPTTIVFNVDYLRGIAFVKVAPSGELMMKYFDSEDLPLNDKERLDQLFKMNSQWSLEEIEPYIVDFVEQKGVYEFLTKLGVRSGIAGGKTMFYSS